MSIPHPPSILDSVANVRGSVFRPLQQAAPSAPQPISDPLDLVARALAILAEETEACDARRAANLLPGKAP